MNFSNLICQGVDGEVGKGENMVMLDHSGHASWTLITKKNKNKK